MQYSTSPPVYRISTESEDKSLRSEELHELKKTVKGELSELHNDVEGMREETAKQQQEVLKDVEEINKQRQAIVNQQEDIIKQQQQMMALLHIQCEQTQVNIEQICL